MHDAEAFGAERLGWRSHSDLHVDDGYVLQPDARRFETGTVDAPAFVGLRQAIAVQRRLGGTVPERLRELRRRLLEGIGDLPLEMRSRASSPTGIVVVRPPGGGALDIVTRMWTDDRVAAKHLSEKGIVPDAIRNLSPQPGYVRIFARRRAQSAGHLPQELAGGRPHCID